MSVNTTTSISAKKAAASIALGAALIASAGAIAHGTTSSASAATASAPTAAHVHHHHEGDGGPNNEVSFRVRAGKTIVGRQPRGLQLRIWKRFTTLIPADERRHVRRFNVFTGQFAEAYVAPIGRKGRVWELGVRKGLARDKQELDYTLVHEFAHLLTLKASQVPPQPGRRVKCKTYNPGEGCALPQSYIARYFTQFWRQTGLSAQWGRIQRIRNDNRHQRAMEAFYLRYEKAFVTDYAASHPAEDIAESFTAFVMSGPIGDNTVADQKIRFFEQFPELVELRDEIRQRGGIQPEAL